MNTSIISRTNPCGRELLIPGLRSGGGCVGLGGVVVFHVERIGAGGRRAPIFFGFFFGGGGDAAVQPEENIARSGGCSAEEPNGFLGIACGQAQLVRRRDRRKTLDRGVVENRESSRKSIFPNPRTYLLGTEIISVRLGKDGRGVDDPISGIVETVIAERLLDGFQTSAAPCAGDHDMAIRGQKDFCQGRNGCRSEAELASVGKHRSGGVEDAVDIEEENLGNRGENRLVHSGR